MPLSTPGADVTRVAIVAAFLAAASLGCVDRSETTQSNAAPPTTAAAAGQAAPAAAASQPVFPLRVDGAQFVDASGRPFEWRGITAFRLAAMIAGGQEQEAIAYLDWAASERLTIVRVLLTAQHLFKLTPEAGRAALPRLLDLAKARGLAVEVVALADTKEITLDYDAHVREIGRVALERGNAVIELANEPGHPTQDARLHNPEFLQRLAALLPDPLIVALGSVEYGDGYAAADYATTHGDRGTAEWDHVLALAGGARRVEALRKPLVSDEPIGAAAEYQRGRRDNDPSRFAAAAALTRLAGLGATFHYEGGLQTSIPKGREAACFAAWQLGTMLLDDVPLDGRFVQGAELAAVAQTAGVRAAFGRVTGGRAVILVVDPGPKVSITFAAGWKEARRTGVPGVQVILAQRSSP